MFSPVQPAAYLNSTTHLLPDELSAENAPVGKEGVFATGEDACLVLGTFESVFPNLCAHFLYRNGIIFFFLKWNNAALIP